MFCRWVTISFHQQAHQLVTIGHCQIACSIQNSATINRSPDRLDSPALFPRIKRNMSLLLEGGEGWTLDQANRSTYQQTQQAQNAHRLECATMDPNRSIPCCRVSKARRAVDIKFTVLDLLERVSTCSCDSSNSNRANERRGDRESARELSRLRTS